MPLTRFGVVFLLLIILVTSGAVVAEVVIAVIAVTEGKVRVTM